MAWCWQHDADKRPPSHHISLLASATEFPRLSDVITFDKQVSLSQQHQQQQQQQQQQPLVAFILTKTYILWREQLSGVLAGCLK